MRLLLACSVFAAFSLPAMANVPSICDGITGNLVTNCGFETGDTTGWTFTPAASGSDFLVTANSGYPNSGTYGAAFGAVGSDLDMLSQILPTVAGQMYDISFYLTNFSSPGAGQAQFYASWDGTQIFSADSTAFPYTQFSFVETGTGNDTLSFSGLEVPSWYALDDVVVTGPQAVPEPAGISLMAVLLLLAAAWFQRRQSSKTNL